MCKGKKNKKKKKKKKIYSKNKGCIDLSRAA